MWSVIVRTAKGGRLGYSLFPTRDAALHFAWHLHTLAWEGDLVFVREP